MEWAAIDLVLNRRGISRRTRIFAWRDATSRKARLESMFFARLTRCFHLASDLLISATVPRRSGRDGGLLEKPEQALRLLIVEDSEDDAEILRLELIHAGFTVILHRVETEDTYLEAVKPKPDIILADYTLPQFSALRALRLLQALELDIPFIVVMGSVGEDRSVECMRQGATDYLLKDRLARLGPAVVAGLHRQGLTRRKAARRERRAADEERCAGGPSPAGAELEAVGLLASGSPHDFNNILTVISGHCDLVLEPGGPRCGGRNRIQEIDRAAELAPHASRDSFSRSAAAKCCSPWSST